MNHRKAYASVDEAKRSKDVVQNGHEVFTDCPCGQVHTRKPEKPRAAVKPVRRDTGPSMQTRAMVYARDLGCCCRCGVAVANVPHSVHHRTRRSQLGLHEFPNLLTLCGSGSTGCHGYVHGHIAEAEAAGWLLRSTGDPLKVPVRYATPGGLARFWLTDDGARVTEPPSEAAA